MRLARRIGAALLATALAITAAPFLLIALVLPGVSGSGCRPEPSRSQPAPSPPGGGADVAQVAPRCGASGELVLPLPPGYTVSDGYGWRNLGMGTNPFHRGVDLVAPCGTPVFAMMSGTVVSVDRLTIMIETTGIARIGYLHTYRRDHLVGVGDKVVAGQRISAVGSEPPSTGCHLDVRVDTAASSDARSASLIPSEGAGWSWVDPERFARAFGISLRPD